MTAERQPSVAQVLSRLYYTTDSPAAFSGVDRVHAEARKELPQISRDAVRAWLATQLTYSLHKPARRNYARNRIVLSHIDELWQADLADMSRVARQNGGVKFLLLVIDVFSKQMFARPLKNKTAVSVRDAFRDIFAIAQPETLQTDMGTEFRNRHLKALLDAHEIRQTFARNPRTKACVAERAVRTLKSRIYRLFTHRGTNKYVDQLQPLVDSYNASFHRTIKMSPAAVTPAVATTVFANTYGVATPRDYLKKRVSRVKPLKVGQTVRLGYELGPMEKRYLPNWQDSQFKVTQAITSGPALPVYRVSDESDQTLPRRFYASELQPIKGMLMRVKVLRRDAARGRVLVQWLNQSSAKNQWIPESQLEEV